MEVEGEVEVEGEGEGTRTKSRRAEGKDAQCNPGELGNGCAASPQNPLTWHGPVHNADVRPVVLP